MSKLKKLISEIHHRSLWQVLLIYVGGAWACYELIDTITSRFELPEWLPALAAVLFLLGLPFVVATACVREDVAPPEDGAPAIEAGRVEAERQAAVQRRRLLTWRNAGLSFLVTFALWGVVAAGWMLFGGGGAETHAVAEELNARFLLEGGVLRAAEAVRINVQLIDAEQDEHVWAQTYDRPLSAENLLAVQSEVALRVADARVIVKCWKDGCPQIRAYNQALSYGRDRRSGKSTVPPATVDKL